MYFFEDFKNKYYNNKTSNSLAMLAYKVYLEGLNDGFYSDRNQAFEIESILKKARENGWIE